MTRALQTELYEKVSETFAAYARYESRELDAGDFEQDMWLILFDDGLSAETPAGEPLVEQTPAYIAQWAAGRARAAILRSRSDAEQLEALGAAMACGHYPAGARYNDNKHVFGPHVGDRPADPAPLDLIASIDASDWRRLIRRAAITVGADPVDLVRLVDTIEDSLRHIAIALLAGYSIREIERSGESRRQVNKVKRTLRTALAT